MDIKLPTEEHIPNVVGMPKKLSMIVLGSPKVGKTTFGSEWEKALILEAEPGGAAWIRCRKLDVNSMEEMRQAFMALKDDKEYDAIIVDSLDRVAQWIEEEICASLGTANLMENKKGERYGSQWAMYQEKVLTFLAGMTSLNKRLVFLAHVKKAELADGTVINPRTIQLYGQTASRVMAIVENIAYMFAKEDTDGTIRRYLSFKPGIYVEAGSRHPALSDKVIEIPLGGAYKALVKCFESATSTNNGVKAETKTKQVLSTTARRQ